MMFDLTALVRPNILALEPYASARDEHSGEKGVFLDANENPYGALNRYPDPFQKKLKTKIAELKGVALSQLFLGNGSDEVIDLLFRVFCQPMQDEALIFTPTYGMYQVSAAINAVTMQILPLNADFDLDNHLIGQALALPKLKLIFLCSPNNPTGNPLALPAMQELLQNFKGLVVVDEAYIDFSERESMLTQLVKYPNLVVMQTLSKAWGLASARIGMAFANEEIIGLLNKVKPPYNIGALNQQAALEALSDLDNFKQQVALLKQEKLKLETRLREFSFVSKIYPSQANFLLVEVEDAPALYTKLLHEKVVVRNRHRVVNNCLRISIGTPIENQILLDALSQ